MFPAALKAIKDQLGQLETLVFCAGCLVNQERQNGAVFLDLQAPQLDSLADLRWADPSGQSHRWLDVTDRTDPNSLLQPLLRAADRAWGLHRAALQLPGISLVSAEPDSSVLTDVAKTAVALDLPLELDDDGSPSAQELIAVFAESAQRRVLEQQLSHALAQPQFSALIEAEGKTVRQRAMNAPRPPAHAAESLVLCVVQLRPDRQSAGDPDVAAGRQGQTERAPKGAPATRPTRLF